MALVLPAYCTREEVRRALDVKQAAWNDTQIDRAIDAARDSINKLMNRSFYPNDTTFYVDWPNFQRSYPWRVWLDAAELADVTVNPPVVTSGGTTIPNSAIFWGNPRYAPPYDYLELDRSQSYSFGSGATPQRNIAITGTRGYWLKTSPAGTFAADAASGDTTITVSSGSLIGVGDLLIAGNPATAGAERMVVTDAWFVSTSYSFTGPTTASLSDNIMAVSDGTKFSRGEVLQIDSEWCLVQNIIGNNLTLKRAWDGSLLATHSAGTIYAKRSLSVLRGQLGTTAAAHTNGTALSISVVPGLIKQLSVAEAIVSVTMEPAAYAGSSGDNPSQSGQTPGPPPGQGLPDLRDRTFSSYGRKGRQRVI